MRDWSKYFADGPAKCPVCDVPLGRPTNSCESCLRSPQERTAWLIQKWRAEGTFVEPPPQPKESLVEEFRKNFYRKPYSPRNAMPQSGKTWEVVPDVFYDAVNPEEAAVLTQENDERAAAYLAMSDAEFAAELRRRLADPIIRPTITNPDSIAAYAAELESRAEKLNGENHERQTGAPEGNLTT